MYFVMTQLVLLGFFLTLLQATDIPTKPVVDTLVQRQAPGIGAPKKLWWAKEITKDFHVAGRLSERQIKYAADGGFKSIISLYTYDEPDNLDGEYLPSSKESAKIAELAGLQHKVVLGSGEADWASVKAVEKLTEILPTMKKPVLLHCHRGYTISFVTFMHMANASKHDSSYTPKVDLEKFYKMAALMGIDFTMDFTQETATEITGEPIPKPLPFPNANPLGWHDYWMAHPVYKNWFIAGQIRESHVGKLQEAGFIHIINMRMGVQDENGNPSQEQVTLLNVKDGSPTYGNKAIGPRQITKTLESIVLNPDRKASYISPDANVNYETKNSGEFGDEIGYNEDKEKEVLLEAGFQYYHMPIALETKFSPEHFGKYKAKLLEIGRTGEPILVHDASLERVAYMTVLASALQYDKDMNWALKRIGELGFEVSPSEQKDVYIMFSAWLDKRKMNSTKKEEL